MDHEKYKFKQVEKKFCFRRTAHMQIQYFTDHKEVLYVFALNFFTCENYGTTQDLPFVEFLKMERPFYFGC